MTERMVLVVVLGVLCLFDLPAEPVSYPELFVCYWAHPGFQPFAQKDRESSLKFLDSKERKNLSQEPCRLLASKTPSPAWTFAERGVSVYAQDEPAELPFEVKDDLPVSIGDRDLNSMGSPVTSGSCVDATFTVEKTSDVRQFGFRHAANHREVKV